MPGSLNRWQVLGLILTSALLWMYYVQWKDRQNPEPRRRLLRAFLLGIAACVLAMFAFDGLAMIGVPVLQPADRLWTATYCFLFIGPIEEGFKLLVAVLFVFRWRDYDEPLDGFVYAAAISLGFASAENFYNTAQLDWPQQLAHTVSLPLTHTLFSAIWGFGLAYARFQAVRAPRRFAWQIGSVLLAMFVHGLYDFLLFAYRATFVTSAIALMLWLAVLWRVRSYARPAWTARAVARRG